MKLEWKRTKWRSIADSPCGKWSLFVWHADGKAHVFICEIGSDGLVSHREVIKDAQDIAAGEAECEAWLSEKQPKLQAKWYVSDSGIAAVSDEFHGMTMTVHRAVLSKYEGFSRKKDGEVTLIVSLRNTLLDAQLAIEDRVCRKFPF